MPQKILREYCESHHIDYIDFTEELAAKARSSPEGIPHYFLDEDHFTRQGHELIAQRLLRFLLVKKWGPLR